MIANPNCALSHFCLTLIYGPHMNIFFIVKVKVLMLVKWSYMFLHIMLTIEFRIISMFWARSLISFKHTYFWCPFLKSTPHHMPLGLRCFEYSHVGSRHIYLSLCHSPKNCSILNLEYLTNFELEIQLIQKTYMFLMFVLMFLIVISTLSSVEYERQKN